MWILKMINQLVKTPKGNTSGTKFWYTISMVVATFVIIYQTLHSLLTWEVFGMYLMVTGSAATLSKFLALRYNGKDYYGNDTNTQQDTRQSYYPIQSPTMYNSINTFRSVGQPPPVDGRAPIEESQGD